MTKKEDTTPEVAPTEPTQETPVVPKEETIQEMVPQSEVAPKKSTDNMTVPELQSFYGITNDELHSDQILKEKYNLSKEQMQTIRFFTNKAVEKIEIRLDPMDMPDYILKLIERYGINVEILKDEAVLTKLIAGDKKPTEEETQNIHQLTAYYNKLVADSTKPMNSLNPALTK